MPIHVECDECFASFNVPEKYAGRNLRCKHCQAAIRVPRGGDDPAEAIAESPASRRVRTAPSRKTGSHRASGKKKSRSARGRRRFPIGLPALIGGSFLGLLFIGALLSTRFAYLFISVAGLAAIALYLAGWAGILIRAFQDGPAAGVACFFAFPLYAIYAAITDWENYSGGVKAVLSAVLLVAAIFVVKPAGGLHGGMAEVSDDPTAPFPLRDVIIYPPDFSGKTFRDVGTTEYHVHELLQWGDPSYDEEARFFPDDVSPFEPAVKMQMRLYMPPGEHDRHSLPCVLVPPAGTNLLTGSNMDEAIDNPEHLPYVKAGYCVVTFSLDGPTFGNDTTTVVEIAFGYREFLQAQAGLVNVRTAFEFASCEVDEIDPQRIYIAGHSSAATLALLFAAHNYESWTSREKLAGCIAYAPECDVEAVLRDAVKGLSSKRFPGIEDFIVRSSPKTHAAGFSCPVFLFHAEGDQVVPFSRTKAFYDQLKALGKDVTLVRGSGSDHYQTMIDAGIPAALEWLGTPLKDGGESSATPSDSTVEQPASNAGEPDVAASPSAGRFWQDDSRSDRPVGTKAIADDSELEVGMLVFARGWKHRWCAARVVALHENGQITTAEISPSYSKKELLDRHNVRLRMTDADVPDDQKVKKEFDVAIYTGTPEEGAAAALDALRRTRGFIDGSLETDFDNKTIRYIAVRGSEADRNGRWPLTRARILVRERR